VLELVSARRNAALARACRRSPVLVVGRGRFSEQDPARLADWFEHADRATWKRLGFTDRPPRLQVEHAFSLMGQRAHQAPGLCGVIALVEFLAGAALLRGVRS